MNIRDMHIEVNQSLQKVAANVTRKIQSEEMDWVLNKMVDRFIQLKLKPKKGGAFSVDQLGIDALRGLLISRPISAYIDSSYSGRYEVPLPFDYSYLISDSSQISLLCGTTPVVANETVYLTWLKRLHTSKVSAPFYSTAAIIVNGNTLNIPASLPYSNQYAGFSKKEDISFLSPFIVQFLSTVLTTAEIGFERYGQLHKPDHFVIKSITSQPTASLTYDGIAATNTTTQTLSRTKHTALSNSSLVANRLENSEDVPDLLQAAFYKPSNLSPISELVGNNLYVYSADNFTVNSCRITYVRKPQKLSLALGTNCDIVEEFHQSICDLAVEYIKGRFENGQGQQLIENDNNNRVNI